jgi:serine/threonine-protein kinase
MSQNGAFIEMLLQEARIAATLSHPKIVQVFEVGQAEGQHFIAMEHVHGEDLRSIVRQMKSKGIAEFPLGHALAITIGMCSALAYAHDKRDLDGYPLAIVHRDISPQNVMISFDGDVKLVDFGIAQSEPLGIGDGARNGKLKGKVPYMSPEQARGDELDARSDLFALGTMLFELTTGKRLFKGQSEYETLRLICDREYPRPSEVLAGYPAGLEPIVLRALAKDKADRYPSAREMQADLEFFVRQHRIDVSSLSLSRFMQSLFAEKRTTQTSLVEGARSAPDRPDDALSGSDANRPPITTGGSREWTSRRPLLFAVIGAVFLGGSALGGAAVMVAKSGPSREHAPPSRSPAGASEATGAPAGSARRIPPLAQP